ncbi:MAG: hypothetical protein AB7J46_02490 [Candidatus Altimarinota bacterium]
MGLFRSIANSTKNMAVAVATAAKGFAKPVVDFGKQMTEMIVPGGKAITDWVSTKVDQTLNLGEEWLINKPLGVIQGVRDKISEILSPLDRRSMRRGAEDDKVVADVLRDLKKQYGETELGKIQGRGPFVDQRIEYSQWIDKAVSALDRYPPDMDSDETLIKSARRDQLHFTPKVEAVRNAEHKVPSESDKKIISSVVGSMNRKRQSLNKPPLMINTDLTYLATQQSDFNIHQSKAAPVDLFFLMNPPIQEEPVTKKVRVVGRDKQGRPKFNLTREEEELFVKDSEKDLNDGTYELTFKESPASFAKRAREQYQKMQRTPYEQFEISLSHENRNYIYEGDTQAIFDFISEHPAYEKALMGDYNEIGMGIMRAGSKVVINFFLMKKDQPQQDEVFTEPTEVETSSNWWFQQIPAGERGPDSLFHKAYYGEGDPKKRFDSGYSLYQLYLFQKRLEELGEGYEISLVPEVDFHPREKILTRRIPMLHIKVKVNNEVQLLKLVKGTDFVDVPQRKSSKNDPDAEKSVGEYITLNEYFEEIKEKPVARHYHFSGKGSPQKPQHAHPEEDTELPPQKKPTLPVEAPDEELSSRVKKSRSNILDLSQHRASRNRGGRKAA